MNSQESTQQIQELQIIEQNLQNLAMQKQSISMELNEALNAIKEVGASSGEIYKITGQIMLKSDKEKILKDLEEKKKIAEMQIETIEKQEKLFDSKAEEIRKEAQKPSSQEKPQSE